MTTTFLDQFAHRALAWADAQDAPPPDVDYDDVLWVDLRTGDMPRGDALAHGIGWPVPPLDAPDRAALLAAARPHAERAAAAYHPSGDAFDEADITRAVDRHLGRIYRLVERVARDHETSRRGGRRRVDVAIAEVHPDC